MSKFRKKAVVIEAFQMTKERRTDNGEWPEWLNEAWQRDFETVGAFYPLSTSLVIHTLSGPVIVQPGYWILRGVHDELYPCEPDIFEATYEAV